MRALMIVGALVLVSGSALAAWPPSWMRGFLVHPGGAAPPATNTYTIIGTVTITGTVSLP